MNHPAALLMGAGVGATLMYFLDPDRGRRRRALVRDQAVHAGHRMQSVFEAGAHDLRNRAQGYGAALRASEEPPGDHVLEERVRARIGRVVSHPSSIEAKAAQGRVTLSGPVLAHEVPLLIDRVLDVPGVQDVENRLEAHSEAGNVPGLQGRPVRRAFAQGNWSPGARAIGGMGGGAAALYGFGRGGLLGTALGIAGSLLLARAVTNLELRRLTGIGAARRAVDIQKTIRINAPVGKTFKVWADCDNYPQFMTHVRHVRRIDDSRAGRRWRWTVRGPAGMEFDFDTTTTAYEENRFIAWRTEPGSLVQHAGRVRFQENPDGTTTADVRMTYNPVAGAVGHVVARLFGADARSQMNDDLMRMKTFVETGVRAHDAAAKAASAAPPKPAAGTPPPTTH
ncbi:cyclase [Sulfurifustis variabilis]|uniref:Cyclase n=1 Tax=Sulfurifustis variabilis TaxID=1675686 RepID=A0A1B4V920_9GAMM|nr:SRPBCC family protein [Sulfurifustis variabilis]BAU47954.1 cyclase [Sulfurifustis variabilis]